MWESVKKREWRRMRRGGRKRAGRKQIWNQKRMEEKLPSNQGWEQGRWHNARKREYQGSSLSQGKKYW